MFSAFLITTLFRIFLFLSPFSFLFWINTSLISATLDTPDVADNSIKVLFVVGRPRVQLGAVSWLNSLCFCLPCQLLRQASVCIIMRAVCWELFRSVTALCPVLLLPPNAVSFCSERYTQQFRFQRHYQWEWQTQPHYLFVCRCVWHPIAPSNVILSRFSRLGLDYTGLLDTPLASEFTGSFSTRLV
jgi:hypothetical protein